MSPAIDQPEQPLPPLTEQELQTRRTALAERIASRTGGKYVRVLLAALSGIPWVGSMFSAASAYSGETEQEQVSELQRLWLEEHQQKLTRLAATLTSIIERFEEFGAELQARIQSEEYLALVRKSFRSWDQADTEEKRELIRKLLTNAGGTQLCSDDLVRLFIAWIDTYHESHFAVIRVVHQRPGVTRGAIWQEVYGQRVREDSAEADLFKLLIRDLSTGGVIRQHRDTNAYGEFLRKPQPSARGKSPTVDSAFDQTKPYELTELGQQFVHYTMSELVSRVGTNGVSTEAENVRERS